MTPPSHPISARVISRAIQWRAREIERDADGDGGEKIGPAEKRAQHRYAAPRA